MKYVKALIIIFCFLGFFFFFAHHPRAQQAQVKGWSWTCLKIDGYVNGFEFKVSGTGLPTDRDIYVVGCTEIGGGVTECTTGQADYNNLLKVPNPPTPANTLTVTGEGGPKKRTTSGALSFTVQNPQHYIHVPTRFFAVSEAKPVNANVAGDAGAQQQAVLDFENLFNDKNCTSLTWDPEGRAFDAKSLEPIPNVNITILDKENKFFSHFAVQNPLRTDYAGEYNFYAPEGDYYLSVSLPQNYTLATSVTEIQANYSKAYYNIYNPKDLIVERIDTPSERSQGFPDPEHRDIALIPQQTPMVRDLVTAIPVEYTLENGTRYAGKVSHPLTIIEVKQGTKTIKKTQADKFGSYDFIIPFEDISPYETVKFNFIKFDLVKNEPVTPTIIPSITPQSSFFQQLEYMFSLLTQYIIKPIYAETQTVSFEKSPHLKYLEGYAYDNKGTIVPQAQIKIMEEGLKSPYFITQADEKGYFLILPEYVPIFSYFMEIVDPKTGTTTTMQTYQFASLNKQYLADNKISLVAGTKNKIEVRKFYQDTKQVQVVQSTPQINTSSQPKDAVEKNQTQTFVNNQLNNTLVILFILLLFGGIGILTYFFIMKRKNNNFTNHL